MSNQTDSKPQLKIGTAALVINGLFIMGLAFFIGWIADHFFGGNYRHQVLVALMPTWHALLLGLAFTPVYLAISELIPYIRERFLHLPSQTINDFAEPTSTAGYAVRAIFSGAPEEILLRGIIQAMTGLWLASLIFSLLHFSGKKSLPYVASTFIYGLLLGGLYIYTGNLWVTIVIHVINNFLAYQPAYNDRMRKLLPRT